MDRPGGELISSNKEGRERRLTSVPLIIRAARSHAAPPPPLMHVSWAHNKACKSVRVLVLASARVGRTRSGIPPLKGFSLVFGC